MKALTDTQLLNAIKEIYPNITAKQAFVKLKIIKKRRKRKKVKL